MKQKLLASIAVVFVITSGVITPLFSLVASAQNQANFVEPGNNPPTTFGPQNTTTTNQPNFVEPNNNPTTTQGPANDPTSTDTDSSQDIGNSSTGQDLRCGLNVLCALVQFVGTIFTFASNLIATVAGLVADFALWFNIQSGSYGVINPFLESGWKLVRDFTNLVFIFALFVVGFVLIFDTKSESTSSVRLDPKRTIAYVIIMAFLVNFSFFITRSIIEVGNITATILYSSITGDGGDSAEQALATQNQSVSQVGSPSTWFTSNTFPGMKSVGLGILNKVNPQEFILNEDVIKESGRPSGSSVTGGDDAGLYMSYEWSFYVLYIFLAIATAVFNLVLTYIFITMALLFIGRYIGLAFLIIFSPLAFVSKVIPSLESKEYIGFTDWFSELIGLTFVAPMYLLFIYLTIMFLNTNVFGAKLDGYIILAVVVSIKLILVSFVLLRGKSLAVSMSGHIGKMAGGAINTVAMAGVGLATAGTGMLAAQTFGRAGGALAKSGTLQRLTQSKPDMDIDSVARRQSMATGIRKLGVGRYNPLRSSMNKLAGSVEKGDLSVGAMKAKAATGVRTMSKSFATVNPYDIGIGGMTGRKGLASLASATNNSGLAQGLAKDFVNNPVTGIKKTTAINRMFDIEASKNAKKTLTNTISGAMTAGLNSGMVPPPGGTPPPPATPPTGTPPVTPPTTTVTPPARTPGTTPPDATARRPENNFNGTVDFDRPRNGPGGPTDRTERPADAAQKEESVRSTGIYDREKQKEGESMNVENLTVKNLNIESGGGAKNPSIVDRFGKPISSRTESGAIVERPQDRATSLLSGIHTTPKTTTGATNYKPTDFVEPSQKPVGLVDQYGKPISSIIKNSNEA